MSRKNTDFSLYFNKLVRIFHNLCPVRTQKHPPAEQIHRRMQIFISLADVVDQVVQVMTEGALLLEGVGHVHVEDAAMAGADDLAGVALA